MSYIYALYEIGKEDDIRYVGKTNNLKKRLRDHINDSKNKRTYKECWINSVYNNGGEINIKIIEKVDISEWEEKEIFWINNYKNKKLTNSDEGGKGTSKKYEISYADAKKWIKDNKPNWVTNMKLYKKWSKQNSFPKFLPKAPRMVFEDFISSSDYLSTDFIATYKRKKEIYLSYTECKNYLRDYHFNIAQFRKTKLPSYIPTKPYNTYKDEWIGWEDFLSYKSKIRNKNNVYLTYKNAKTWIINNYSSLSSSEFRKLSKEGKLPINIPKKPERYYKNDWISFVDFLNIK